MPTVPEIESFCRSRLAEMLEIDEATIAPETSFASLGLDSAAAVHFVLEIEQEYGVELYPGVTQDHPNVSKFAEYLASL